ncbi:hypothetical protein TPHA_0I00780 [Tetrapisispora phaffii CBS 4417]|uniref:Phosphatidic acid phosphatase type 2/haloperoxidase domain-containing protein n=1 Tax=Tetrapisispora phaffii (strain ATCC 24235 / CBS 4417 / NBRC 1672 / NRRL Y-8282 / UCD 70-5) TaxID=1071381 RepID=G8BXF6_TETPH|nr:hypothetical protein TPHA_0I00780 [Tetrapisispora phaffii CBS 4417]CCE64584.1 hypothetical protein TPHA_0I00780 [Tetrapisispora phaffii CBS 4417]
MSELEVQTSRRASAVGLDALSGKTMSINVNDPKYALMDPGTQPNQYFKAKMSPFRYAVRQYLKPYTNKQSLQLFSWQQRLRTPGRDSFFKYTSLMGSHTFYVLCIPMPPWLGHYELVKDLVYLLGYSIYISGFLKDYWCLPRPISPPLKRITLSKYTTREYGAPSSHTANATSVSILFLINCWNNTSSLSLQLRLLITLSIFGYYITLVAGRVYCGMHGLLDLFTGAFCGVVCVVGRRVAQYVLKDFDVGKQNIWYPVFSILFANTLLFNHVKSIDPCPCFEDSVAFIGVVSGIECGDWFIHRYAFNYVFHTGGASNAPLNILFKILTGVTCVSVWMYVISKPLLNSIAKNFENEKNMAKVDILKRFTRYFTVPVIVTVLTPFLFSKLSLI